MDLVEYFGSGNIVTTQANGEDAARLCMIDQLKDGSYAKKSLSSLSSREVTRIASQLHPDAIIPTSKSDSQEFRESLVMAFAELTDKLGDYLMTCDSVVIDQTSGDYVGTFFEELCGLVRKGEKGLVSHSVVGSRKLPHRVSNLEHYFRDAFERQTVGHKILIVTEHADSGDACETLAKAIRTVADEFNKKPEICIASLSAHPLVFFSSYAGKQERIERWEVGQKGLIGVSAFRHPNLSSLSRPSGGAVPVERPASERGEHVNVAHQDMAMLARELAPLVLARKSE